MSSESIQDNYATMEEDAAALAAAAKAAGRPPPPAGGRNATAAATAAAAAAAAAGGAAAGAGALDLTRVQDALLALQGRVDLLQAKGGPPPIPEPVAAVDNANPNGRPNVRFGTFSNDPEEDFLVFRHHIDQVIRLNQYSDEQARLALASAMKGRAAAAVMDINPLDANATYPKLMGIYESRFLPAASSQMARMKFDSARQGPHEDVLDFHARLRTLHNKAYPKAADEVILIRRFSIGLRRKEVRTQVMRGQPATYQQALEMAQNETSVIQMVKVSELGNAASGVEPMDVNALSPEAKAKLECYYCGRRGHIKADCRSHQKDQEDGRVHPDRRSSHQNARTRKRKPFGKGQLVAALQSLLEEDQPRSKGEPNAHPPGDPEHF